MDFLLAMEQERKLQSLTSKEKIEMNNFCSIIGEIEKIIRETDYRRNPYNISEKFEK